MKSFWKKSFRATIRRTQRNSIFMFLKEKIAPLRYFVLLLFRIYALDVCLCYFQTWILIFSNAEFNVAARRCGLKTNFSMNHKMLFFSACTRKLSSHEEFLFLLWVPKFNNCRKSKMCNEYEEKGLKYVRKFSIEKCFKNSSRRKMKVF